MAWLREALDHAEASPRESKDDEHRSKGQYLDSDCAHCLIHLNFGSVPELARNSSVSNDRGHDRWGGCYSLTFVELGLAKLR